MNSNVMYVAFPDYKLLFRYHTCVVFFIIKNTYYITSQDDAAEPLSSCLEWIALGNR